MLGTRLLEPQSCIPAEPHPQPGLRPRSPGPGLRPQTTGIWPCAAPGSGCWAHCGCRVSAGLAGPWGSLSREAPGLREGGISTRTAGQVPGPFSPPQGDCPPRGVPWPCREGAEEQWPGTGGWLCPTCGPPRGVRAPGAPGLRVCPSPGLRVCPSPVLEAPPRAPCCWR